MNAQDAFGVAVRTVGLIILLYGAWTFLFGWAAMSGKIVAEVEEKPKEKPAAYLFWGIMFALAGVLLIRGAPALVDFAYQ